MAGSPPNLHTMDSRSACIQGVLKVKVKVKGHVIRALGMSYSVIDGLVVCMYVCMYVCIRKIEATDEVNEASSGEPNTDEGRDELTESYTV